MKRKPTFLLASILFMIAVFSFHSVQKGLLLADYLVHTEKYELNCVNKAKPEKHCNGKCQLVKEMSQDSSEHNELLPSNLSKAFSVLFFQEIKFESFLKLSSFQIDYTFVYHRFFSQKHTQTFLQPPILQLI